MSPVEQQPLRVRVKGMTEKMLNVLQYFFRDPDNNYCEIVEDEPADVTIIDLDGVEGRKLVAEHSEKNPEQPLIVLSIHDREFDNAILLRKPLKPESLMQALEVVNEQMQRLNLPAEIPADEQPEEVVSVPIDDQSDSIDKEDEYDEVEENLGASVDIVLENTGEMSPVPADIAEEIEAPQPTEPAEQSEAWKTAEDTDELTLPEGMMAVGIPSAKDEAAAPESLEIAEQAEIDQQLATPGSVIDLGEAFAEDEEEIDLPAVETVAVIGQPEEPESKDESGYIGSAPDIDPNDPVQLAKAQYDPENYFQSHIQQAVIKAEKFHQPVMLTMPHGSLVILSDTKSALLDIKESKLRAFCGLPITDETLTIVFMEKRELLEYSKHATPITLEQLIWKSAVWASRGRVPTGTDLNSRVYFQHWPNISRSFLFPNAMTIASHWLENPCSLIETAKVLQIPQRYVFAFYSASNAIGIAFVRRGATSETRKFRKVETARDKNLLGRLLGRLHGTKRKITGDK